MRRTGKEEQVQGIKHRSRCWLGAFLLILSVDVSAQLHISRSYMWGTQPVKFFSNLWEPAFTHIRIVCHFRYIARWWWIILSRMEPF
jgi:hypothetical protein